MLSGWIAGKLLAPVNTLGQTAGRMSDAYQHERFELDSPYQEFQQLAKAFNAMIERFTKSCGAQRHFVDYAAHELQTPLTVLQTNLEITLHKARTVEEYRDALIANMEQVERLATLARDLLTLSRLSGTRSPVRLVALELKPLLQDVIDELYILAEESQLHMTLEAENVPPVYGDPQWLKQLISNLLDNAIRYTGAGQTITVRLRREEQWASIAVEDTGPGIDDEHLPHLFERFYRIDTARARNSGGTGLGLPIVKEIAEAHGGTIAVESAVGKGSTFTLRLPLAGSS
jgi:heavy metal sensor kinase